MWTWDCEGAWAAWHCQPFSKKAKRGADRAERDSCRDAVQQIAEVAGPSNQRRGRKADPVQGEVSRRRDRPGLMTLAAFARGQLERSGGSPAWRRGYDGWRLSLSQAVSSEASCVVLCRGR